MSIALHEGHQRMPVIISSEAERIRIAEEFDTSIDSVIARVAGSPKWFTREIGDQMRFVYLRGDRPPYARKFVIDKLKERDLAFLFEREGARSIRQTVYYMMVDERQRILSEMLSVKKAGNLPAIIRLDFGDSETELVDFVSSVQELLRLNPTQEAMVERKIAESSLASIGNNPSSL